MIGHVSGMQPPANDTERQLLTLLQTYRFTLPGGSARTLDDFLSGFSLTFALYIATLGVIGLVVVRLAAADAKLMSGVTIAIVASCATLLAISVTHFFLIPTLFIAVVTVCFAGSLVKGPLA